MSKKYENIQIEIEKLEFPNKGIGKFNDEPVYIKNTIPGQIVIADIKKKKGKIEGRLKGIEEKAPYEINPLCDCFGLCGGCTYQSISYEKELEFKKNMVIDLLNKGGITDYEFCGIKASPLTQQYRNKMEFSFGDNGKDGELTLGMRKRDSYYEVINADKCMLVHTDINKILACVLDFFKGTNETFYHKMRHTGSLRHLLVRRGHFTNELLINLVTTSDLAVNLEPLKEQLLNLELDGSIQGIIHSINDGIADVIKADEMNILYGKDWFTDKLLGLEFKISVFSFFQTNSAGAEVLYSTVKEFINQDKNENIFDLYCGTGTIAQLLSKNAKKVYGIEIVQEAVEAARVNARLNNIDNCEFMAGDVLNMVDKLQVKPEIIVLDPPREGIHPKAIEKIINFDAETLVYVSCKASSLTKDLKIFEDNGYKVKKIQCVDMFPRTYHVETVVLLKKTT